MLRCATFPLNKLAAGLKCTCSPLTTDPYVLKTTKTDWPDVDCFRIRLAERNGDMFGTSCSETFALDDTHEAHWDDTERVLTIYLAKAEKVVLRYSSFFQAGNEWLFAVWDWLKNKPDLLKLVQNGCLWMVTPYRKLELVHAVQQPLCEPRFDANAKTKKTSMANTPPLPIALNAGFGKVNSVRVDRMV